MKSFRDWLLKTPVFYLFQKLWRFSDGNRHRVVLYSTMFFGANIVDAFEPLIIGLFLDTIQLQGVHASNIYFLLLLLALFPLKELLFWSLHGPARVIEEKNAFGVRRAYKTYLLQGTMDLPIEWHVDHHSGDTIDKIEKGTTALFNFSERTFELIQGTVALATSFGVLFWFNHFAGLSVLVLTVATFFILTRFDKRLVPGYKVVNNFENTVSAKVFDALSNVTTVIILRVESLVLGSLRESIGRSEKQFRSNTTTNEFKWFSASILGRLAVVSVIGLYLYAGAANDSAAAGGILVGTVYILYGYANQIRETFFRFAYLYNDIIRYRASVSNAEELSMDFRMLGKKEPKRLPQFWKKLSIKGLSFSYHGASVAEGNEPKKEVGLHLDDISLEMSRGSRIALIGESGGGKSTFLKVLRDLYRPKNIYLLLDGEELIEGFASIKDSISLVPQDPELFATTVRENITLGVDYSDARLREVTDLACFSDVVARLPKGLDSSIVEKGVNLSGGEKQRLALARGLLASADKDIVLLDEPTSSVDFRNELRIYQNIFSAFPKKTILSSIHRLHLLSLFDQVCLFRDGKVIASGTFEQLKESSPDFRDLWEKYIRTRDGEEK